MAVHRPNSFRPTIVSDVDYAYTGTDCEVKLIDLPLNDLERIITPSTSLWQCGTPSPS